MKPHDTIWDPYIERYRRGGWRGPIFRDMVLHDIRAHGTQERPVLLDIGCGRGFDDEPQLQSELAAEASQYVGVEPDSEMPASPAVTLLHRSLLEEAAIPPSSIDIAFSVMVVEHVENPRAYWAKIHEVLKDGGISWAFTIDRRNWFASASYAIAKLRLKDRYLTWMQGEKRTERYENYPVFYRSNRPIEINQYAHAFRSVEIINFHRIGQLDSYLPKGVRWLGRWIDRYIRWAGKPGSIIAIRTVK